MQTAALEELNANYKMSVVYRPFMHRIGGIPQVLETVLPAPAEQGLMVIPDMPPYTPAIPQDLDPIHFDSAGSVIEMDGLVFINRMLFTPDSETEKSLNPEFKKLIDSVIHRKVF